MIFEELRNRYGAPLAVQIMQAMTPPEFNALEMEELASKLQTQAEQAYSEYTDRLDNTPIQAAEREQLVDSLNRLRTKWQEAEELAYHVLDIDLRAQGERRILPGA